MADQFTTLRHALSQQKPLVPCAMRSKKNTSWGSWPDLNANVSVTIWDEFNLHSLNESYGHILDLPIPERLLMAPRPDQALASVVVNNIGDINHLISWNDRLVQPTLQFAKSHLRLHPGVRLYAKYSTADKSALANVPSWPKKLAVDHIIALDDFPGANLVVGLGRPSSMWSGRKLANQLGRPNKIDLSPLRQLANICDVAQTRYGYIQTDEEMVVCRFSRTAGMWKVNIMPIPWSRNGVDVITTDLALWWLCMLAMSAHHHRAIVEEGEMIKLDDWDVIYLGEERGWVRRHRYSNVEETTSPPAPPDYRASTTGSSAAFAADTSFHASDWFSINSFADADLIHHFDSNSASFDDLGHADLGNMDMDPQDFHFTPW